MNNATGGHYRTHDDVQYVCKGFVEVRHVDVQHIVIPSIVRRRGKFFNRFPFSWEVSAKILKLSPEIIVAVSSELCKNSH